MCVVVKHMQSNSFVVITVPADGLVGARPSAGTASDDQVLGTKYVRDQHLKRS